MPERSGTPAASVVMPVGSVDAELISAMEALARQDFAGSWELVVSLNTDDPAATPALETALSPVRERGVEVRVVDSSSLRSAAHARNVGARAAAADLLAFCDGDDLAEPNWLSELLAALEHHGAVGGHLDEDQLAIPGQEDWRPPATPGDNPSFLGHSFLVSANMAVRSTDFAAAGGFDEGLLRGEDIAFSWALLRNGVDLGFAPGAVIHYRHRRGLRPMLRQHYLYGRGMAQILRRYGTPDGGGSLLSANNQAVSHRSRVHYLRRGAIAAGRLVGLAEGVAERFRTTETDDRFMSEPTRPTGIDEGVH